MCTFQPTSFRTAPCGSSSGTRPDIWIGRPRSSCTTRTPMVGSGVPCASGAPVRRAHGAAAVSTRRRVSLGAAAPCGIRSPPMGVARDASTSGDGRSACTVTAGRCTTTGTRAPKSRAGPLEEVGELGGSGTTHTAWTGPWRVSFPRRGDTYAFYEYACHEGNKAMRNILQSLIYRRAGRGETGRSIFGAGCPTRATPRDRT
jgi:hypothetical protein